MSNKYIDKELRAVRFKLTGGNRSLDLCAQMNYETENLDFIDNMEENSVLYDLGACEGRFSIYAAAKGYKIVSFEPEANNFSVLKSNIEINSFEKKITPLKLGIGEKLGELTMQIGQPWPGGHQKVIKHNHIREDLNFDFKDEQMVKVIDLDSAIESENLPFPNYLKIDIDGSEVPFIKGAEKTLRDKRVKGVIFELDINDSMFNDINNTLKECGWNESERYQVPNEPTLFNIIFVRD